MRRRLSAMSRWVANKARKGSDWFGANGKTTAVLVVSLILLLFACCPVGKHQHHASASNIMWRAGFAELLLSTNRQKCKGWDHNVFGCALGKKSVTLQG